MSDLVEVIWRKGAGKNVDDKGNRCFGGKPAHFERERAEGYVRNTLAYWPEGEGDGDDGLRGDGERRDSETPAVEQYHGDDQAAFDE